MIGGEWRGRRLAVLEAPGLRPTGDRLRETLFNWLRERLVGARCLDLYAGSGALGIEALSRGAAEATFVECEPRVAVALGDALATLGAGERARVVRGTAAGFLDACEERFDLVFVDPPFADEGAASAALERLAAGRLADGARVYVERDARAPWPTALPGTLALERERRFGEVVARLLRNAPASA